MKVLSIRQPWAWAVVSGHKTIENRTWRTAHRGPLLIHAGSQMSAQDLSRLQSIALAHGFAMPEPSVLKLGGIVGQVDLADIVSESHDPWFRGPYGWVLTRARPLRFRPLPGRLRLFTV